MPQAGVGRTSRALTTMTQVAVAFSNAKDGTDAGREIGAQIRQALSGRAPDALIVFASARYEHRALLDSLHSSCSPRLVVGCSSAGEFTSANSGAGSCSALALCSDSVKFSASVGRGISEDHRAAVAELVQGFVGNTDTRENSRVALVFADPLSGYGEAMMQHLTLLTDGRYQFAGGGAGDDGKFEQTHVFYGREAIPDALVALEMLSDKPIAIGAAHGWHADSAPMRVTEATGLSLRSLNAVPAADVYSDYADERARPFDRTRPLPFFLHHVLGIDAGVGPPRLRVPLGIEANGAIRCASEVPAGATVSIMQASVQSATEAAQRATQAALQQFDGTQPSVALFFDCVATRLRMGEQFALELSALHDALPAKVPFVGFNTYGQIVRAHGQFNGFHNCTAVVCLLPD